MREKIRCPSYYHKIFIFSVQWEGWSVLDREGEGCGGWETGQVDVGGPVSDTRSEREDKDCVRFQQDGDPET